MAKSWCVNRRRGCASRVTVVVLCVCMCVYVISFLLPHASRPQNIRTYVFTATQKPFITMIFTKNASFRNQGIICFLKYHQLHLSSQIQIPTECVQRGLDIAICNFSNTCFIQKLQYICLPPLNTNLQFKYMCMYITSPRGRELVDMFEHIIIIIIQAWDECVSRLLVTTH